MRRPTLPLVIGLVGPPFAGKDTVGEMLVEMGAEMGQPFEHFGMSLHGGLYDCALAIDPYVKAGLSCLQMERLTDVVQDVGWTEAKRLPDVRRLLQRIGTDMGREVLDPELWVRRVERQYVFPALRKGHGVAINGIRFDNEVTMVEAHCGTMWRVTRPGCGEEPSTHATAEELWRTVNADVEVVNDGTLDDLRCQVRRDLKRLIAQATRR